MNRWETYERSSQKRGSGGTCVNELKTLLWSQMKNRQKQSVCEWTVLRQSVSVAVPTWLHLKNKCRTLASMSLKSLKQRFVVLALTPSAPKVAKTCQHCFSFTKHVTNTRPWVGICPCLGCCVCVLLLPGIVNPKLIIYLFNRVETTNQNALPQGAKMTISTPMRCRAV